MNLLNAKVVLSALGIVAVLASPAFAQRRQHVTHVYQSDVSRVIPSNDVSRAVPGYDKDGATVGDTQSGPTLVTPRFPVNAPSD